MEAGPGHVKSGCQLVPDFPSLSDFESELVKKNGISAANSALQLEKVSVLLVVVMGSLGVSPPASGPGR